MLTNQADPPTLTKPEQCKFLKELALVHSFSLIFDAQDLVSSQVNFRYRTFKSIHMKKLLLAFIGLTSCIATQAQTAPDFTATDCNGNSVNLYSQLNAGKVVVLNWVMPCGACVGPSLTAYNVVQSFASPDVVYYLIDDMSNTNCTQLGTWADNSNIGSNRTEFSTSAIVETNYGGTGMPHVAVVGPNHTFYFNGLNAAAGNATAIQNAISSALATGINQPVATSPAMKASWSAGIKAVMIQYNVSETGSVTLDIMNELGQSVSKKEITSQSKGNYSVSMDLGKPGKGLYFVRMTNGSHSETVKFSISN